MGINMENMDFQERTKKALENKEIPRLYCNGFVSITGSGDIAVILERNGDPVAIINLSYTLAKSLGINLLNTVSSFEDIVGRAILTTDDIIKAMMDKEVEIQQNAEEK